MTTILAKLVDIWKEQLTSTKVERTTNERDGSNERSERERAEEAYGAYGRLPRAPPAPVNGLRQRGS